jgi:hypothetical protein
MAKLSVSGIDHLNDYDLLNWILEQEFPWRDALNELCNPKSLQELVDYVRINYKQIKQIENEKARINREA